MLKILLSLSIGFASLTALATTDESDPSMVMCGALTQIQNSKVSDIEVIERKLLMELKKRDSGVNNQKAIYELSEDLDALRIEMRQLDQEIRDACN